MSETIQALKNLGIVATTEGKTQYRVATRFGVVIYCTKHEKWQFHGRTFHGDLLLFKAWLKRQGMLS